MAIQVESEVGRLRRVLVHRPGREIDRMAPRMMEQLLFDDILFARDAREEHAAFCTILNKAGAETLYAGDLLAECLARSEVREPPESVRNETRTLPGQQSRHVYNGELATRLGSR